MFEATSRYNECGDASFIANDERIIKYKSRRFIPHDKENAITIEEISITDGDRIDLISANHLGDAEQFWRLCDMNEIMHPLDLTSEIGKIIKITSQE